MLSPQLRPLVGQKSIRGGLGQRHARPREFVDLLISLEGRIVVFDDVFDKDQWFAMVYLQFFMVFPCPPEPKAVIVCLMMVCYMDNGGI